MQPRILSKSGAFILMHDAGTPIDDSIKFLLPFKDFCCEFLSLMRSTLFLQETLSLVHGDIHEGNVLFNAQEEKFLKLRLIDWDESGTKPMERIVVSKVQKERYPAELLQFKEEYTKLQLIILFRDLSEAIYSKVLNEADEKSLVFDDSSGNKSLTLIGANQDRVNTVYKWLQDALFEVADPNDKESLAKKLADFCKRQQGRKRKAPVG